MASKYGNVRPNAKTELDADGHSFDSLLELRRYRELKLLEKAEQIDHLRVKTRWEILINGKLICHYEDDFNYCTRPSGRHKWTPQFARAELVVEDCKGVKTAVYSLKKKLMLAVHGIKIREVTKDMVSG
tara:strand:+ start:89 stop:475 length:387 start_codon:yes stop_codon:yes gene_type:complete